MQNAPTRDDLATSERYLSRLLGRDLARVSDSTSSLAVVGGAVRDVVWHQVTAGTPRILPGRDVDLAVLSPGPARVIAERLSRAPVRQNRYGGYKTRALSQRTYDLWHWDPPASNADTSWGWEAWLGRVDFAINAVAYLWPQRRIVFHPAWQEAMARHSVWPLTKDPICRQRDALRAIGLQSRYLRPGSRHYLHDGVLRELDWLLLRAAEMERVDGLGYFLASVGTAKYPVVAMTMLMETVASELGARALHVLRMSAPAASVREVGEAPSFVNCLATASRKNARTLVRTLHGLTGLGEGRQFSETRGVRVLPQHTISGASHG